MTVQLDQEDITGKVMVGTVERLLQKLKVEVTDASQAKLVRAGKLQDDPSNKKINVLIHEGGEDWPDHLSTEGRSAGKYAPNPYAIGGATVEVFWRRYLRVEFQLYYANELSRENARIKTGVVLNRARHALLTWDIGREIRKDSFGEHAYDSQVIEQYVAEGGGVGDFFWRGELVFEYLTETEPTDL